MEKLYNTEIVQDELQYISNKLKLEFEKIIEIESKKLIKKIDIPLDAQVRTDQHGIKSIELALKLFVINDLNSETDYNYLVLDDFCQACDDKGYLEVETENNKTQILACDDCNYIGNDLDDKAQAQAEKDGYFLDNDGYIQDTYWTSFNYIEFQLPKQAIVDCSQSGSCDDQVEYWQKKLNLNLDREKMIKELSEHDLSIELQYVSDTNKISNDTLEQYCIWLAAGDIRDNHDDF